MSTATDQFRVWATQEIDRLRREADALELTLKRYLAAQVGAVVIERPAPVRHMAAKPERRVRGSKYEPLFQLFEEQDRPLSLAEMEQIARDVGQPINRHLLRSTIFIQKKAGRAIAEGDRYRWVKADAEAASAAEEDAA